MDDAFSSTKRNRPIDLGRLALVLDQAMSTWVAGQDRVGAVRTLNRVAAELDIIGGAFGVANVEKNEFTLSRSLESTQAGARQELFPYLPPSDPSALNLLKDLGIGNNYSEWMHRVFGLQRERQRLKGATGLVEVPEFYKDLKSRPIPVELVETILSGASAGRTLLPLRSEELIASGDHEYILVTYAEICGVLKQWLDIWSIASISPTGLYTTCAVATSLPDISLNQSLYGLVSAARDRTMSVPEESSSVRIKELPEEWFFFEFLPSESADAETARLLREVVAHVPIADVRRTLSAATKQNGRTWDSAKGSDSLFALLQTLHKGARFPVIPYLVLCSLDNEPRQHCALPLLHSQQFPLLISLSSLGPDPDPRLHSCMVVFLGTLGLAEGVQSCPQEVAERMAALSLFMRRAAEPLADVEFYGGIQRRQLEERAKAEASSNTYRGIFISITHELSKLQAILSDDWLLPLPDLLPLESHLPSTFGTLRQSAEQFDVTKDWQVIVVPELYKAAADKFTLWTGKGWIERVGLGKRQPLAHALGTLIEIITASHIVSKEFVGLFDPEELRKWQRLSSVRRLFNTRKGALATSLKEVLDCDGTLEWNPAGSREGEPEALFFVRLFSASLSNALEKTDHITVLNVIYSDGFLYLLMENEADSPAMVKPEGTEAVIRFLVTLAQGKADEVVFHYSEERKCWVTAFAVPASFITWTKL